MSRSEILPTFFQEVRDSTYLGTDVTPQELYWKLLIEYFGQSIKILPNAITDLPGQFKRLAYQMDAVSSGFRLLEKHNGFFLADCRRSRQNHHRHADRQEVLLLQWFPRTPFTRVL